jgi:homoserine kinase
MSLTSYRAAPPRDLGGGNFLTRAFISPKLRKWDYLPFRENEQGVSLEKGTRGWFWTVPSKRHELRKGMSSTCVRVRVPASTSNLGPGFDCLGLALNLYNTTTVSRQPDGKAPAGMIAATADAFFERALGGKLKRFPFEVKIDGDIPVSRGLGSSVTVRLGGLMGLAELVREDFPLSREQILNLLIDLEGHPDNAVASFLGGFAVCCHSAADPEAGFSYARVPVQPELSFVTLVPDLKLSTEMARGLLPREVPFLHAVENAQRTARITAAFCLADYDALRGLFIDHFHQPFRQTLIPGFADILEAAMQAGALGSFLSGAGSSLMAVTLDHVEAISAGMMEAARRHGLSASVRVLRADNDGVKVEKA